MWRSWEEEADIGQIGGANNDVIQNVSTSTERCDTQIAIPDIQEASSSGTAMETMKTFIAILALIGCTFAVPAKNVRDLGQDLDDLLALLPTDQMLSVAENYLLTDAEVQADFEYLQSEKVVAEIDHINEQKEVKDLYSWLYDHGVDIYSLLNTLNGLLGWHEVGPDSKKAAKALPSHRTFQELLDDEIALIPIDDVKALFDDKLANSEDFKELWAMVTGDEFHAFVDKMFNEDQAQEILTELKGMGVDVDEIVNAIKTFFGWE